MLKVTTERRIYYFFLYTYTKNIKKCVNIADICSIDNTWYFLLTFSTLISSISFEIKMQFP